MKLSPDHFSRLSRTAARAFTLVEMLMAVTVFSLLILATVAVQIYALRVYTLAATKLNATQSARATMNAVRDQVREARLVYVGNYTNTTGNPPANFTPMTDNNLQQGNALMIYPTLATNSFTLVYLQPQNGTGIANNVSNANSLILITYTNGGLAISNDIADFVTNQIVFDAENFMGSVLATSENNYLIHMTLDFSQFEYPIASLGTTNFNAYDYYQLNTVMTRRDTD
jgi:prepilin-type N-terminal cleavage/methylation domain-containing protein